MTPSSSTRDPRRLSRPSPGPDVGFQTRNVIISGWIERGRWCRVRGVRCRWAAHRSSVSSGGGLTTLSDTPAGSSCRGPYTPATLTYADDAGASTPTLGASTCSAIMSCRSALLRRFRVHRYHGRPNGAGRLGSGESYRSTRPRVLTRSISRPTFTWDLSSSTNRCGPKRTASAARLTVLNGVPFDEATNPLMAGHCIFADSEGRQNGPPDRFNTCSPTL